MNNSSTDWTPRCSTLRPNASRRTEVLLVNRLSTAVSYVPNARNKNWENNQLLVMRNESPSAKHYAVFCLLAISSLPCRHPHIFYRGLSIVIRTHHKHKTYPRVQIFAIGWSAVCCLWTYHSVVVSCFKRQQPTNKPKARQANQSQKDEKSKQQRKSTNHRNTKINHSQQHENQPIAANTKINQSQQHEKSTNHMNTMNQRITGTPIHRNTTPTESQEH